MLHRLGTTGIRLEYAFRSKRLSLGTTVALDMVHLKQAAMRQRDCRV